MYWPLNCLECADLWPVYMFDILLVTYVAKFSVLFPTKFDDINHQNRIWTGRIRNHYIFVIISRRIRTNFSQFNSKELGLLVRPFYPEARLTFASVPVQNLSHFHNIIMILIFHVFDNFRMDFHNLESCYQQYAYFELLTHC